MNDVATAGGLVVRGNHILLIRRGGAMFAIPKGHVEAGESAKQAAIREVEEETGVKAEIVDYLGEVRRQSKEKNGETVIKVIKVFKMTQAGVSDRPPDEESEWVDVHGATDRMYFVEEGLFLKQQVEQKIIP